MAANTIEIKFRKDSRSPAISITVDLDELILTTKKRETKALEKLFDPSKELDPNQSLKFMAFGRVLEDDKKWSDYQKSVLDLLKITDSSILLSVQTTVQQETKKSASFVKPTKDDIISPPKDLFGIRSSQSDSLYLFHSKKEEKKPLPDNEQENEVGLSEEPSDVIDPMESPPKRKSSCNLM